jgi:hypothetical protein
MGRWIRPSENRVEWGQLLSSYQSSSFRLEAQQIYSNPIENGWLADFLAGRPLQDLDFTWRLSRSQERIAAGCTKITVRVVIEPQTDYTRMQLATYRIVVAGGEDVRVIVVPEGTWPDGLPRHDFFLFDERDVWRMHYSDDYNFVGAEQLDGPDVLAQHLRWRDRALELAIPLLDYSGVAQLPS